MAVSIILSDLALRDGNAKNKTYWSRYTKTNLLYDIVISINSLEDLSTHGWAISLGPGTEKIPPLEKVPQDTEGVTVAILGAYNRGKTFILSQLCRITLPHNNLMHTEGISITAGKTNYTDIVFMDTAGIDTPETGEKAGYKRATEALLREVVVYLSSFIIIVVNRLRATDQIYIGKVLEHCKNRNDKKGIIIVHNLYDVESTTDIETTIKEEVEGIFGAKKYEKQFRVGGTTTKCICYISKMYDFQPTHFILGKYGSPAGKVWNLQSFDAIMNMLQAPSDQKTSFKIISRMIEFINTRLPQLFSIKSTPDSLNNQDNVWFAQQEDPDTIQIAQHENQPCIVLSSRKAISNLSENPYPLDLSQKLVYDDAGYFIKNARDLWAPRYNLYEYSDRIRIILELPGFNKGDCNFNITENSLTVQGNRSSMALPGDVDVQSTEIPVGKFRLDISLKRPIDVQNVKSERQEGLVIITAPKKLLGAIKLDL